MKEDRRELEAAIRSLEEVAREDDGYDAGRLEPRDIAIVLEELERLRLAVESQRHTATDAIVVTAFTTLLLQVDSTAYAASDHQIDLCLERARRVAGRFKEALENEAYRAERARKQAKSQ